MHESPPTIHALRIRWPPHKERLAVIRGDHPTAIRFHRSCSWLSHVEKYDPIQDIDQVLLHQWIAFNLLYGQWDEVALESASDRRCWQTFLGRVMSLDRAGHLVSMLHDHKPLVLCILEDEYLNQYFWQDPCEKTAGQARNGRHRAQSWYVEGRWLNILEQFVTRIYLLRRQITALPSFKVGWVESSRPTISATTYGGLRRLDRTRQTPQLQTGRSRSRQITHGAATCSSRLNRKALKHCTTMLGWLLPATLQVWIDHGADEDWGPMCYPSI